MHAPAEYRLGAQLQGFTPLPQTAIDEAGQRVYRQLSAEEQARLRALVTKEAKRAKGSATAQQKPWAAVVESMITESIERRTAAGADVDATAIVEEVLPAALAAVPEEVRAAVMAEVHHLLGVGSAQDLSVAGA